MAHILTQEEAFSALRISSMDECPNLGLLMSAVDDGIKTETGKDWTAGTTIDPTAKLAASLLLICLKEGTDLPKSYGYKIVQLEAKALEAAQSV